MDGELAGDERADVDAHLQHCLPCRHALAEVRGRAEVVTNTLSLIDRPAATQEAWAAVQVTLTARHGSGGGGRSRTGGSGRAWVPARWTLARAAGLVLLFAGGAAAAALPGSPIHDWLFGSDPTQTMAAPAIETATTTTMAVESGSWTRAVDGAVRLALEAPAGTEVEVRWTGQRAGIQGPSDTHYTSEQDGQLGARAESGPLAVELPVAIRAATLRVNGTVVLEIVDGRVGTMPAGARGTLEPDGAPLRFEVR
jgi:hypothetical protein